MKKYLSILSLVIMFSTVAKADILLCDISFKDNQGLPQVLGLYDSGFMKKNIYLINHGTEALDASAIDVTSIPIDQFDNGYLISIQGSTNSTIEGGKIWVEIFTTKVYQSKISKNIQLKLTARPNFQLSIDEVKGISLKCR